MKLSKVEILKISLLTFSLFFGAGNLMFPPMLGKEAGTNLVFAMLYFSITAIIFPILAIIVVTKTNGLKNMANRVDKTFGMLFTIATALAIGPGLAVPRAGVLPYEIALSHHTGDMKWALLLYTTIFFGIVCWFCLTPSKLLDRISKFLSPLFLFLIILLLFGTMFKGMTSYAQPLEKYVPLKGVQGFLDGYMTLDTLAGLMYGLVISYVIKDKGITDEKEVIKSVSKTGIVAGIFLFIVYFIIAHIGGVSGVIYPDTKNGLEILRNMSLNLYGQFGFIILVMLFFIACLNIAVGVTTSISQYFSQLFPKISYKYWVIIWIILSCAIANNGLAQILSYSVPVLLCIYPVAVELIVLSILNEKIKNYKYVYSSTIYTTLFISFVSTLDKSNIKIPMITDMISKLPLYKLDLEWILVAIIVALITIFINKILKK